MEDLELLNLAAQIRHVFGSKSLIWGMKEGVGDVQEVWQGHRRRIELTVENGRNLFSRHQGYADGLCSGCALGLGFMKDKGRP